eukprot:53997_1
MKMSTKECKDAKRYVHTKPQDIGKKKHGISETSYQNKQLLSYRSSAVHLQMIQKTYVLLACVLCCQFHHESPRNLCYINIMSWYLSSVRGYFMYTIHAKLNTSNNRNTND